MATEPVKAKEEKAVRDTTSQPTYILKEGNHIYRGLEGTHDMIHNDP